MLPSEWKGLTGATADDQIFDNIFEVFAVHNPTPSDDQNQQKVREAVARILFDRDEELAEGFETRFPTFADRLTTFERVSPSIYRRLAIPSSDQPYLRRGLVAQTPPAIANCSVST